MPNATHHAWTLASIRHGLAISQLVGGKPFIVNTPYNGAAWSTCAVGGGASINVWCHPPRRGLGISPTTHRSPEGRCVQVDQPARLLGRRLQRGAAPVGSWWPERALMYARFQTSWLSPPRGTILGFSGWATAGIRRLVAGTLSGAGSGRGTARHRVADL